VPYERTFRDAGFTAPIRNHAPRTPIRKTLAKCSGAISEREQGTTSLRVRLAIVRIRLSQALASGISVTAGQNGRRSSENRPSIL